MSKAREEIQLQEVFKPIESTEDLNQQLNAVQHSSPEIPFPNHLLELRTLGGDKNTRLVEGYMQSVLARVSLPHYHHEQLTNDRFFEHLSNFAADLVKEKAPELELDLYIGGGVVRALLENLYKFVHERKTQQHTMDKPSAMAKDSHKQPLYEDKTNPDVEEKSKKAIQLQIARKDALFKSSEYHLKQATLAERDKLLGPFVLGVGSDLDIYYEAKTKTGLPLNDQQQASVTEIKKTLFEYINRAEKEYALRYAKGAIKHSLLPIADVKEYHSQITRSLEQGGSLLDALAFKLTSFEDLLQHSAANIYHLLQEAPACQNALLNFFNIPTGTEISIEQLKAAMRAQLKPEASNQTLERLLDKLDNQIKEAHLSHPLSLLAKHKTQRRQAQLRMPEGHPHVLKDFLEGVFDYLAPLAGGKASQKQAIRGLRALVSLAFIQVKDERILVEELTAILKDIEGSGSLDEKAKEQFDKLVRNAYHQLGGNRPYQAAEGTALNLGLRIAEAVFKKGVGLNEKVRFLLPSFIQNLPLDKRDPVAIKAKVAHFDALQSYFVRYQAFIKDHTEQGTVYHGTSAEAGICVLRGGFIESTAKQGTAIFGPALYATQDMKEALKYGASGLVLPLRIASGEMRVLDWKKVPADLKKALDEESTQGNYEHVFQLLRDRKKYAVDVIVDTHVLIQNQRVIDLDESLESIFNWVATTAQGNLQRFQTAGETEQVQTLQKLMNSVTNYQNYTQLFTDLKVKVSTTAMTSQALVAEMMECPPTVGLFAAAKIRSEALVKEFFSLLTQQIGKGPIPASQIDVKDERGDTFLRYLVDSQLYKDQGIYTTLFKLYLYAHADVNAVGSDGRTVFQLFFNGYYNNDGQDFKALKLFIEAGADLDARDPITDQTPLMAAVIKRDNLLVLHLGSAHANPNLVDNKTGDTPLHVAVNNMEMSIVDSLLLAENIDPNVKNNRGRAPLHDAVVLGNSDLVVKLLNLDVNAFADATKADVDLETTNGDTALDLAIDQGDEEIAGLLINHAKANVNRKDRYGWTVLAKAIEAGMTKAVQSLAKKADVNQTSQNGDTPLHLAVRKGDIDMVSALVAKANVNLKNSSGDTPLLIAAHEGHQAMVRLLTDANANVEEKDSYGDTPLCLAVKKGDEKTVAFLIEKSKIDEALLERLFSLCLFDKRFNEMIFKLLLKAGLQLSHKHLLKAIHLDNQPAIHFLLNDTCSAAVINQVLVDLAAAPSVKTFDLVLDKATDLNAIFNGRTALMQAVAANNTAYVNQLVSRGANLDICSENCTALCLAVMFDNKDMVHLLLAANANREQAIITAMRRYNEDMLDVLLANYSGRPLNHFTSIRSFMRADSEQRLSQLRQINPYIDFNHLDDSDMTPLMQLCDNGNTQALDLVLEINPNIDLDVANSRGMTAIMYALKALDKGKVLSLLKHDPKPNLLCADKYDKTALQMADQYFCYDAEVMDMIRAAAQAQQKGPARLP